MSLSRRLERVIPAKAGRKRLDELKKYIIAITDFRGVEQALEEMGFRTINYMKRLRNGESDGAVYDIVATNENGESIGIRQVAEGVEFSGYGNAVHLEMLSRRLADLVGAYHVMITLDVHGISYQVQKTSESIIIAVG